MLTEQKSIIVSGLCLERNFKAEKWLESLKTKWIFSTLNNEQCDNTPFTLITSHYTTYSTNSIWDASHAPGIVLSTIDY